MASKASPSPWRTRITGHGEEDPTQLLANPLNWRIHPARQREAIRGALTEVGWVTGVIVNTVTGHVVDGHARVEEAISRSEPAVPVTYVELTEEEERVVLASLDPISALAGADRGLLEELLADITVGDQGLAAMLANLRPGGGDAYSSTIKVPRYEPTGDVPDVSALADSEKADRLRREVMAADLDPGVRDFLLAAAGRHVVFDYGRIAEFYAAAPAETQRLMEASALVILDYEDAIRDGYVRFMGAVAELEAGDRDA